jgi:hypothetical protein
VCIEDRLPEGANAVLINRNHTETGLALSISDDEKGIYVDIDEQRTIGERLHRWAQKRQRPTREQANRFLEKRWGYDQVVLSMSGKAA